MEKEYMEFIEEFRQVLLAATGYEEDRIYLKKKEEYPPTAGDRLFLECEVREESREVCGLYVRELYERYTKGASIEEMTREVLLELKRIQKSGFMGKALELGDYEKVKDSLFIRLLNVDRNREDLHDAIYREIGDIALVLYMAMGETEGCFTSIKIRKDILKKWHGDEEVIFREALLNTYYISPPRIYQWEKLVFDPDYSGENFMNLMTEFEIHKGARGNCLSTTKRTNGAVAVFLPGVAQRIGELLGSSFYMVFTSIHEVMIHNDEMVEPQELKKILRETIREATPEEDFLTYLIFHYDKDTGKITFE
ncbi:MAG: DUF5688 family protein [Eubacteriales bacterium]|nr:DUF5688 family protein [Eubacteriales bacterium]